MSGTSRLKSLRSVSKVGFAFSSWRPAKHWSWKIERSAGGQDFATAWTHSPYKSRQNPWKCALNSITYPRRFSSSRTALGAAAGEQAAHRASVAFRAGRRAARQILSDCDGTAMA